MAKPKGLTRNVTRRAALSYERVLPNPIGVTAIASVNGRGARNAVMRAHLGRKSARSAARAPYSERYATTRRALRPNGVPRYAPNYSDGSPFAPAAELSVHPIREVAGSETPFEEKKMRRKKAKTAGATKKRKGRKLTPAQRKAALKNLKKARAARKSGGATVARKRRRSAAKRPAAAAAPKRRRRRAAPRGRVYAGHRALNARIGRKSVKTYMYAGKGGSLRKLKPYQVLGFSSEKALAKHLNDPKTSPKEVERIRRRLAKMHELRARAGARTAIHGDAFHPNAEVISYEEWSDTMKANGKRRRVKRRKATGATKKRKGKKLTGARLAAARRNLKKARAAAKRKKSRTRTSAPKRARRSSAKRRRRTTKVAAAPRRRRRRVSAKRRTSAGKKPSKKALRRAIKTISRWSPNRRRRSRRGYARNGFRANDFMAYLKDGLMTGGVIVVGFLGHKALTKLLDTYGLSKIEFLGTGAVASWRGTIASAIVAALGIGAAHAVAPKEAAKIGGGIVASFLQGLLVKALTEANQPMVAGYFAGYPDASGSVMGPYAEYIAMNGSPYGEYLAMNGFGEPISQAAAGFGHPMFSQAAAGYGAPPMLSQAAAGMGEYIAQGVGALGEYDIVPTAGLGMGSYYTDEGISGGDLNAAEYALNVAEAAAGVNGFGGFGGFGDIPLVGPPPPVEMTAPPQVVPSQSIVNPVVAAAPIEDVPRGARAGILGGGNGIFGTANCG